MKESVLEQHSLKRAPMNELENRFCKEETSRNDCSEEVYCTTYCEAMNRNFKFLNKTLDLGQNIYMGMQNATNSDPQLQPDGNSIGMLIECLLIQTGQNGGVNELRKHIVTINSCNHIVTGSNNLPTGKTAKSVFTRYDFQIPKVLNKCMDIDDQLNRGFDQYFCIDKDEGEDVCFVARALHTPSGRTLEIYSNQYAVRFTTANSLDGKTSSLLKNVSISGDNTYEQLFADNNDYDSNQNEKLLYLVEVYETLKDFAIVT
ncbi:aldose-1-epimerase [Holotrichia oblita]|uniref:Aldose-1-epimerase n=1 Tax=Holotrichia oblita TaxID=644536 RepID=A0ACB9T360_HOLOL|nr:aldose-1-epimerase [Holotrichia oblita]